MDGEFLVFTIDDKTSIINQSDSQRFRVVYQFVSPSGVSMPQVTYNFFSMWIIKYKKKFQPQLVIAVLMSVFICCLSLFSLFLYVVFQGVDSLWRAIILQLYLNKKNTSLLNNSMCYTQIVKDTNPDKEKRKKSD